MKENFKSQFFNNSKAWIEYKKHFDALDNADSYEEVSELSDLMHNAIGKLGVQFPEYSDILSDFSLLATAECNSRRRGLHSLLDRRARPDYLKYLGVSIERMLIQKKLVEFILHEKVQDKWIDSRIYTDGLKQSVAESSGYIDNIYREIKYKNSELSDQVKEVVSHAEADIKRANELIEVYEKIMKLKVK